MSEIKTVIIVATLLLAATGFCTYQVNAKLRHHSEIKNESPCEKENKRYCFNGGQCYYLVDEDNVTVHGRKEETVVKSTCGGLR